MGSFTAGQRSWDDLNFDKNQKKEQKPKEKSNNFLKFVKDGDTQIRLISDGFEYLTHEKWMPAGENIDASKVQKYGYNIKCSNVGKGASCPLCSMGHAPIRKWYFAVISREDNTVKIMDVKRSVVQGIKPHTEKKVYGHPSRYDIIVTTNTKADPQHYYSVTPLPPEPLSAEDLVLKGAFDLNILNKLIEVPTVEKTQEVVNKIINWVTIKNESEQKTSSSAQAVSTPASTAAVASNDSADEEYVFNSVN